MRNARFSNLSSNEEGIQLWLEDVKGKDTYGEARYTPLLPFGRSFIERYLRPRELLLKELGIGSDALIPSLADDFPPASSKTPRKLKDHAMRDVGFKFDLGALRRTFGQYLVDSEVGFEYVRGAMGHKNPNTTFQNYAGVRTERMPHLIFKKKLLKNQENDKKGGV
jgi:integrase